MDYLYNMRVFQSWSIEVRNEHRKVGPKQLDKLKIIAGPKGIPGVAFPKVRELVKKSVRYVRK